VIPRRYSSYRITDKGRWDAIPSHWTDAPLRHVARLEYGESLPDHVRSVGQYSVYGSNGPVGLHEKANTRGPVIVVGRKGSFGLVNYSYEPVFAIDTTYFVDASTTKQNTRWLYYTLATAGLSEVSRDTGVPGLSREDAYSTRIAVPPASEQRAIAAFLDRETAKIDGLIAKQTEFLTLLDEHRRALITEAVTFGITGPTPLKNTGSKVFPRISDHWRIARIKHLCSHVVDCLHTTPQYEGLVVHPCIRTADVEPGRILLADARLVSDEEYHQRIGRLRPLAGDIVYSREGERFGIAATIPRGVDLCLGQRMMMFRVRKAHDSNFLMWALNSDNTLDQLRSRLFGATSPHINISDVINFEIAIPAVAEQRAISGYIYERLDSLEKAGAKSTEMIERLRERRSALITAAVTGQIEVTDRHIATPCPRLAAR
jgi:type I restriction enzyme S subunit